MQDRVSISMEEYKELERYRQRAAQMEEEFMNKMKEAAKGVLIKEVASGGWQAVIGEGAVLTEQQKIINEQQSIIDRLTKRGGYTPWKDMSKGMKIWLIFVIIFSIVSLSLAISPLFYFHF